MRKSFAVAALMATAGTASGAGALNLLGADVLKVVTQSAIAACPGATGLVYLGTGTSNGELAMAAGNQAIAPMSSFLGTNSCVNVPEEQTANGIVIGLDGLAILGSLSSGGTSACNGTNTTTCAAEPVGVAYGTTITTEADGVTPLPGGAYTFTNWKDVLAVIYGGQSHSGYSDSGCGSAIRAALANNWGNLFQTGSACASSGTDGCTQLQHAFRRDDDAGATNAIASLIGLSPTPNIAANFAFGVSPFCNVNEVGVKTISSATANPVTITTTLPHGLGAAGTTATVQIVGVGVDINSNPVTSGGTGIDGTFTATVLTATTFSLPVVAGGTKVGSYAMVLLPPPPGLVSDFVPTTYRDLDPIRRPCANNGSASANLEDVCGRDNNLGLVLPIGPADVAGDQSAQFPSTTCTGTAQVTAPNYINPNTGAHTGAGAGFGHCPNGDTPHGGSNCYVPSASGVGASCLAKPTATEFVFNTSTGLTPSPQHVNGLAYNAHLFTATGYVKDDNGNAYVGAWHRIHQAHTIAGSTASIAGGANINGGLGPAPQTTPSTTGCQQTDASEQMGCLVNASPCSIGFDGRNALAWNGSNPSNNVAIKVNQVLPLVQCVQSFNYALSRKLYLGTEVGFAAASAPENGLAQCESSESFIGPLLTASNYVNFATGSAPNNGAPFAEDYNEPMLCGPATATNVVAYAANAAPIPSVGTVCGNGVKEAYEDCDNGTTGNTNAISGGNVTTGVPGTCSTTCRQN